jgi:hypothetical protein
MKKSFYITKEPPTENLKTDSTWDSFELNKLDTEDISYFDKGHRQLIKNALTDYKLNGTNNVELELFSEYALMKAREFNEKKDNPLRMDTEVLSSRPALEWYLVSKTYFYNDAHSINKVYEGLYIDTVRLSFRKVNVELQKITDADVSHLLTTMEVKKPKKKVKEENQLIINN